MGIALKAAPAVPEALAWVGDRFRADDMDVPGGEARIRLEVTDGDDRDAVIEGAELRLEEPDGRPDARLSADVATWSAIAADVRGGMDAFRRGRLRVRENLHLGIGLLAATSGSDEPERLRFGRIDAGG